MMTTTTTTTSDDGYDKVTTDSTRCEQPQGINAGGGGEVEGEPAPGATNQLRNNDERQSTHDLEEHQGNGNCNCKNGSSKGNNSSKKKNKNKSRDDDQNESFTEKSSHTTRIGNGTGEVFSSFRPQSDSSPGPDPVQRPHQAKEQPTTGLIHNGRPDEPQQVTLNDHGRSFLDRICKDISSTQHDDDGNGAGGGLEGGDGDDNMSADKSPQSHKVQKRGQKRRCTQLQKPSNCRSSNKRVVKAAANDDQLPTQVGPPTIKGDSSAPGREVEMILNGLWCGSYDPQNEIWYESRYETWTAKQLRKKCSQLRLRGLKNVKKHVMVDALYRYYRQLDSLEANEQSGKNKDNTAAHDPSEPSRGSSSTSGDSSQPSSTSSRDARSSSSRLARAQDDQLAQTTTSGTISSNSSGSGHDGPSRTRAHVIHLHRQHQSRRITNGDEMSGNGSFVTSEHTIRLVDVVLSSEFVDRLACELSRWQFWVDVSEKYMAIMESQESDDHNNLQDHETVDGPSSSRKPFDATSSHLKWSSMQLWAMWKELTYAYTKACCNFFASGSDERDYINYCERRADVYYLHQRLHARPDLLHLIKSDDYIAESVAKVESPTRAQKRVRHSIPVSKSFDHAQRRASICNNNTKLSSKAPTRSRDHSQRQKTSMVLASEEGSTENSETTGEEGSLKRNCNQDASVATRTSCHGAMDDEKYFGMLLQNFEAIFESLHNKKMLMAALHKEPREPNHLVADLQDDMYVLSALKKEYRNKLRRMIN